MDWNQTIDNMFRLAMTINIPYELFWNITPYEMEIMVDAYKEQQKHANYMMWVNGIYAMSALSATVGNMFRKKNTEPNKYMEEPLPVFKERKELTEEEKLTEEQKLLLTLETMQKAFELNRR